MSKLFILLRFYKRYLKGLEMAGTQEEKLSNFTTMTFVIASVLGFGLTFMPAAYASVGILGCFLGTFVLGCLNIYGIHLMLGCMKDAKESSKNDNMTMSDTITYAFKEFCCHPCFKVFGYLVDILLVVVHFLIASMYIGFIAENFTSMFIFLGAEVNFRIVVAIVIIFVLPLFLLRDINYLVPLNIAAIVLAYIFLILFILYTKINLIGAPKADLNIFNVDFHLFIGFVMFSISSVGVMVTMQSKMEEPDKYLGWRGMLNRAALSAIILNLVFGLIGYLSFGDQLIWPYLESLYLNLSFMKLYLPAAVYLTYPLNGYIPIDIIFNQYIARAYDLKNPVCVEIIIRIVFVILSAAVALGIPLMVPSVKLVCAIALPLLNLIYPACTRLCLGYDSDKKVWWILLHVLMIVLGIALLLGGLYSAYYDITVFYLKDPAVKPFWENELANLE